VFATLKRSRNAPRPEKSAAGIAAALNQKFAAIQDAYIAIFPPPPVQGLGTIGGSACKSRIAAAMASRSCTNRLRT